jgi:hypothetical protein
MESVEPETLALPINTLAPLILREYQANEGWSWRNEYSNLTDMERLMIQRSALQWPRVGRR